ncbi:hypothetical protein HN51_040890 [Arachis hypogaea]
MQRSSSISSSSIDAPTPRCHYGVTSPIRTSWRSDYPGRRFYGCFGYRTSRKYLFFQWYDPEPLARYSDVIRRAKLEAAVAASTAMEDNMLARVATMRRRGVVIIVLISMIVLLIFFPDRSR